MKWFPVSCEYWLVRHMSILDSYVHCEAHEPHDLPFKQIEKFKWYGQLREENALV